MTDVQAKGALTVTNEDYKTPLAEDRGGSNPALKALNYSVVPQRGELRHFLALALSFSRAELKQRYFSSIGGYLWTLFRPILVFGTLYVVFTHIVRLGGDIENYPAYLLMSLTLWTYFNESTQAGVSSLVDNSDIVRKIHFPLLVIPLASLFTTGLHMLLNLLVVSIFLLALGITPTIGWLLAVPIILYWVLLSNGLSMLLSVAYVRFRDVKQIWDVGGQILFWATPIIYVAMFPEPPIRQLLSCNPLSPMLTELRRLVIDSSAPSAADIVGNDWLLLVPAALSLLTIVGGVWAFIRYARDTAEHL